MDMRLVYMSSHLLHVCRPPLHVRLAGVLPCCSSMYASFCSIAIHIDSEIVVPLSMLRYRATLSLLRRFDITASTTWLPASLALIHTLAECAPPVSRMYVSYRSRPLSSLAVRSLFALPSLSVNWITARHSNGSIGYTAKQ